MAQNLLTHKDLIDASVVYTKMGPKRYGMRGKIVETEEGPSVGGFVTRFTVEFQNGERESYSVRSLKGYTNGNYEPCVALYNGDVDINLDKFRVNYGMSQNDLAEELGVYAQHVSLYEREKRVPGYAKDILESWVMQQSEVKA